MNCGSDVFSGPYYYREGLKLPFAAFSARQRMPMVPKTFFAVPFHREEKPSRRENKTCRKTEAPRPWRAVACP